MKYFFFLILISIAFLPTHGQEKEKKTDSIEIKLELLDIKQRQQEDIPVPNFDLTRFNIFVLSNNGIYYYFDSLFTPAKKFDEYRFENLNPSLLRKTNLKELKIVLKPLMEHRNIEERTPVLAVKGNDKKIVDKFFDELFKPIGIDQVQVGFITEELLTILKTIK